MNGPRSADCEEVLRVIFAYLDGELGGAEHARVEAHLEQCRSCLSRAEFERRLKGRLADTAGDPVSDEFEQRIRALIGELSYLETDDGDRPAVGEV
jgi:mycothiol system anti-sigma-R factor